MGVNQSGQRDQSIAVDDAIERPRRRPFRWTDVRHSIAVDGNGAFLDDLAVFIHGDDENISNQRLHSHLRELLNELQCL